MNATARSTGTALLLLFALVVALLAAVAVPAFLSWRENGRIIRENREHIAAVEASRLSFARLKNATDRWTLFSRSPEAGFLDAATPESAAEAARTHLEALLARHGGTLESAAAAPGETKRGHVGTVKVSLRARMPKAALAPFLAELEDATPYTFVNAFTARQDTEESLRLSLEGRMQHLKGGPR